MVLAGNLGQHGHAGEIGTALPDLGKDRGQHVALVELVEQARRAHDFEIAQHPALLGREVGLAAQPQTGETEAGARELTVIGRGVLGGLAVVFPGVAAMTHGLGRTPQPIAAA